MLVPRQWVRQEITTFSLSWFVLDGYVDLLHNNWSHTCTMESQVIHHWYHKLLSFSFSCFSNLGGGFKDILKVGNCRQILTKSQFAHTLNRHNIMHHVIYAKLVTSFSHFTNKIAILICANLISHCMSAVFHTMFW